MSESGPRCPASVNQRVTLGLALHATAELDLDLRVRLGPRDLDRALGQRLQEVDHLGRLLLRPAGPGLAPACPCRRWPGPAHRRTPRSGPCAHAGGARPGALDALSAAGPRAMQVVRGPRAPGSCVKATACVGSAGAPPQALVGEVQAQGGPVHGPAHAVLDRAERPAKYRSLLWPGSFVPGWPAHVHAGERGRGGCPSSPFALSARIDASKPSWTLTVEPHLEALGRAMRTLSGEWVGSPDWCGFTYRNSQPQQSVASASRIGSWPSQATARPVQEQAPPHAAVVRVLDLVERVQARVARVPSPALVRDPCSGPSP